MILKSRHCIQTNLSVVGCVRLGGFAYLFVLVSLMSSSLIYVLSMVALITSPILS